MIAEKALLGTILKNNHLVEDTIVKPEHLESVRHRLLIRLIKKLVKNGKGADAITLSMAANPESFGGISYINELLSYANPVKIDEYEQCVMDGWKNREKRNILTVAINEDWEIGKITASLDNINGLRTVDHKSITEEITAVYEDPWQQKVDCKGVLSGIKKLDALTNGWQDGELTIIAARPSMGETDFLLHLAKQAGWQDCLPIIFSLEMPAKSLTKRLIASTGRINRSKMKDPYQLLSPEQKNRWSCILDKLNQTNIQIFDEAGQSVPIIRAKIRKIPHQYPNKKPIVFIDYLGLMKPNEFYGGNANLQITEISKNLKAMSKDFNCPVICLSQLNRSVEQRKDKRPMMGDVRDSGSVEQDADVILFLYRDKYYDKNSMDHSLELLITKNRNGVIGTIRTMYNENTGEILDDYDQRFI